MDEAQKYALKIATTSTDRRIARTSRKQRLTRHCSTRFPPACISCHRRRRRYASFRCHRSIRVASYQTRLYARQDRAQLLFTSRVAINSATTAKQE